MNAGTVMVMEARRRAEEREGHAVRLRIGTALKARVERCAAVCKDEAAVWVNKACLALRAGRLDGVAFDGEVIAATRGDSAVMWVRQPAGMSGKAVRLACAAACAAAERTPLYAAAMREAVAGLPVEGRDYLVEDGGNE